MAISVIGQERDKTGQPVVVKYADVVGGTPVIPFFYKNVAALMENGHTGPVMFGTNKNRAVYLEIDGKVAGHIVFEILDDCYKTAWITFSCIEENYRRRGLYDILHRYFETIAKKIGSLKIASHVHVDNKARQESCAKVGMQPVMYKMEKDLI